MSPSQFIQGELVFDPSTDIIMDSKSNTFLELRCWGRIQHLYRRRNDSVNWEKAEEFRTDLGKYVCDTLNGRLEKKYIFSIEDIIKQLEDSEHLDDAIQHFKTLK